MIARISYVPTASAIHLILDGLEFAANALDSANGRHRVPGQNSQTNPAYTAFACFDFAGYRNNCVLHGSLVLKNHGRRCRDRCDNCGYFNNHKVNPLQKASSRKFDSNRLGLTAQFHEVSYA